MKVAAVGNLALSLCIGFHYFIRVWSPGVEGTTPKASATSYTLVSLFLIFFVWAIGMMTWFFIYGTRRYLAYGV